MSQLVMGDIVQIGNGTHTFIVVAAASRKSDTTATRTYSVVDSNSKLTEIVYLHDVPITLNKNERAFRMAKVTQTTRPSTRGRIVFAREVNYPKTVGGVTISNWVGKEIWSVKSDGSELTRLYAAPSTGAVANPRPARDGQSILFENDDGSAQMLVRLRMDGGAMQPISLAGHSQETVLWADVSPNDLHLVVITLDVSKSFKTTYKLMTTRADGSDPRLISTVVNTYAYWTPQGQIIFGRDTSSRPGPLVTELYSAPANGSGNPARKITNLRTQLPGLAARHPSVSADGSWIVFPTTRRTLPWSLLTEGELYVMRSSARGLRRLNVSGGSPSLSPDDRWVAYESSEGIEIAPIDGSAAPRLIWRGHAGGLAWSQ